MSLRLRSCFLEFDGDLTDWLPFEFRCGSVLLGDLFFGNLTNVLAFCSSDQTDEPPNLIFSVFLG